MLYVFAWLEAQDGFSKISNISSFKTRVWTGQEVTSELVVADSTMIAKEAAGAVKAQGGGNERLRAQNSMTLPD